MLKAKQTIVCQVTKNPIGAKGARLTQEVSLPGPLRRADPEQRRPTASPSGWPTTSASACAPILDRVKPEGHGIIVRTAAEGVSADELERDVRPPARSSGSQIEALAKRPTAPALLYREPDMAVRVIREEFNQDYRGVVIDDRGALRGGPRLRGRHHRPTLADRVEYYDPDDEPLPLFERYHVHEQLHKALDRKVWLPSGGSLIIEHTEALTVIDVNTGKNVGTSNLEETVFRNNLEAADEIARSCGCATSAASSSSTSSTWRSGRTAHEVIGDLPRRAGPGQDPHPGVRHLRARPGRDDPQAHRRGPARVVLRHLPRLRGPRRRRSTAICSI